jgi:small subunit ribosomal protein S14
MQRSYSFLLIFLLGVTMARKSIIEREKKRMMLVDKYRAKRAELKELVRKATTFEEKIEAQKLLQKLPKNSNPSRVVRRCLLTGRPKGVYRKFGLSRAKLRELAMAGNLPGIKKSSW